MSMNLIKNYFWCHHIQVKGQQTRCQNLGLDLCRGPYWDAAHLSQVNE